MKQNLDRLHGQSGGRTHPSICPEWLQPLHRARASGLMPRGGWVVIQAGGRIAKWVPAVSITPGWKPNLDDDLSAFRGLDCELLIDDDTGYGLVRGLVANATLEAAMRAAMEGERDRVAAELAEVQKTERRLRYLLVALGDAHMPPGRPIWLTNEQGRLLDPHNDLFIPLGGEHHPTNIAAKECAAFVTALRHDADAQLA